MTTFYATDVIDSVVKLVKGGVVSGDNLADLVSQWPGTDASAQYGGSSEMWGNTLLYSDVNLSTFGMVLSEVNGGGIAEVDAISMTVYFSLATAQDNPAFLVVEKVSSDRSTVTPQIYNLPRAGLTVANDPSLAKARDDASLKTSRYIRPGRTVVKTYREVQLYAELDPETNTPGLEIWASVDNGTFYQLLDDEGDAATLLTSGFHQVFFPVDATAVGRFCQLELRVPAKAGAEVVVAVTVRDCRLRGTYAPLRASSVTAMLVLGDGERTDGTSMQKTIKAQEDHLRSIQGTVVAFKDPSGRSGYGVLKRVSFKELENKGSEVPRKIAEIALRQVRYE